MDKTEFNRQSGIALLITITVLFVITALVMTVNKNIRASLDKASLTMQRAKLRELATSGVQIGIAILMEDKRTNDIDTIQEMWADPAKIQEILADVGLTDGSVTLTITDELGKIQVNALVTYPDGKDFNPAQKSLWESFLKMANPPDESLDTLGQNSEIIDCIKDWIDSNDDDAVTGINGAESDYYQTLDPPYKTANAPFRTIDELALVKGIKPEMLNRVEQGYCVKDLLTVYGMAPVEQNQGQTDQKSLFTYPGKININTADLPVIMALMPDSKSDLENTIAAKAIYDYRVEKKNDTYAHDLNGEWYLSCPGCENSGIRKDILAKSSDYFSIVCKASNNGIEFKATAVIHRDDKNGKFTILSWTMD